MIFYNYDLHLRASIYQATESIKQLRVSYFTQFLSFNNLKSFIRPHLDHGDIV